jgi:hypothetical protein
MTFSSARPWAATPAYSKLKPEFVAVRSFEPRPIVFNVAPACAELRSDFSPASLPFVAQPAFAPDPSAV